MKSFIKLTILFLFFLVAINTKLTAGGGGGGGGTPSATSLSCGSPVTINLDASGFAGSNPTSGDGGCNPCCYAGADLDGDGLQDVPFSVENSEWYQYCNSTGSAVTVTMVADETGSGSTCNIQGAVWVGASLDATTMDCGNSEYSYFDSNVGGAADGFSFTVTIPAGQCAFMMVDGYGGATCNPVTISVTCPCTTPVATATPSSQTICSGTATSIALSSSVSGTTYSWTASQSGTTGASSGSGSTIAQTLTATGTTAGTVTYTVTPTSSGCVGAPITVTITVNPRPLMTSPTTATICSGNAVNIPLTSNVPANYTWIAANNANTTGESTTTQNTSTINNTITNTSSSVQTVTYTITPTSTTGSCVGTTQTVNVTVNPIPVMTSANTATVCSGGTVSISLTSNVASSYTWIAASNTNVTGESTTSQTSSTLSNTLVNTTAVVQTVTYTVTPTSTAGSCPGTPQTVTVTVNPAPTMTSANTATICSGSAVSITLTSNIAATYTWIASNNPNTSGESTTLQNTSTLSNTITSTSAVAETVTYTVTPTSTSGSCVGTTQTVTVTVNPAPVMTSASTATICSGAAVNIPLTSNVASTYTWIAATNTNVTGESTTLQNTSTLNNTLNNTTSAVQTVAYTVTPTSAAGTCLGTTQTVTVTVNPVPTMTSANAATICSGTTVSIPLTSNVASTFSWIAADNVNTTGESTSAQTTATLSNTIINTSSSSQNVIFTVTPTSTVGSCPGTPQTVTVTVNPAPVMTSANTASICSGGTVNIPLTADVASSFTWIGSNNVNTTGESTTLQTTSTLNNTITSTSSSIQTVTYTVTPTSTANSCVGAPQTVSVTVNPMDNASFSYSSSTYCQTGANPTPTVTGLAGGTFSSTAGLVFVSTATGQIDVLLSSLGTYVITYTTNGTCPNTATFNVTITTAPSAAFSYAGPYCQSGVNPSPTFGAGASAGTFSALPAGLTFVSTSTGQINLALTTPGTYTVTNSIPAAGGCAAALATNTVTIDPSAISNANSDQNVCATAPAVTLAGSVGGSASTGTWSGGTGSFNPNNTTLNAVYTPSATEITAGTVSLTLTTNDPAGPCPAVMDQMIITINQPATVSANVDQISCASAPAVTLAGSIGGSASSATWSGGTGTFNPDNTTLTAIYTPSAAEITAGTVTLTLTTNDPSGPCGAVSDQMIITINPIAIANANVDQSSCATSAAVTLAGSVGGSATTGSWSGGTGAFNPNNTTLTAIYTPSAAEITAGTVTLTLTTNDPTGPCSAATDQMTITIDQPTTVNAGTDQTVCSSAASVTLAGVIGGTASSATWSGGTGSFNPNNTTLNAIYTPSATEITAGSVTLTLTTNDPAGACSAVNDQITIFINNPATATANADQVVCTSSPDVTLNGNVGGSATSGSWSGGTGSFNPSASSLNAVYTPSAAEILAGGVTLTLTTDDPAGSCPAATDQMIISIDPIATADAGTDQTVCASSATVTLAGSLGGSAFNGTWTGGAGTFNPNNTTLNATYTPSASEISAGLVTLTLTSNDPVGPCPAASDLVTINITPLDDASFSYSSTYCATGTDPAATISGLNGGTFSSTIGLIILNTATGLIDLDASTLGTYTITYNTNGACPNSSTFDVTITTAPSADFSYAGPYCMSASNPFPSFNSGSSAGTFSATPSGLIFVSTATGEIDLLASTPGTYSVTNDIPASSGCSAASFTTSVTIDPSATVSAGSDASICSGTDYTLLGSFGGSASSATWTTSGTGTFDNTSLPGAVYTPSPADISAGSVTLTFLTNDPSGACSAEVDDLILTITPSDDATFSYGGTTFCSTGSNPIPVITGATGGAFSSTSGLSLDAATGEITLSTSTLATYTVTYTTNGVCPMSSSVTITITNSPSASFSYSGPYCQSAGGTASPVFSGTSSGGVFSSAIGLSLTTGTGAVNITGSTPGTYTVYNDIAASGGCASAIDSAVIVIDQPATAFAGNDTAICAGAVYPTTGSVGGSASSFTWGTAGTGIFIATAYVPSSADSLAGSVQLYIMSNDPANSCGVVNDTLLLTISLPPNVDAGVMQSLACGVTTTVLNGTSAALSPSFSWSGPGIVSGGNTSSATVNATGLYTLTVTSENCSNTDTVSVISNINAPNIDAGAADTLTCINLTGSLNGSSTTVNAQFSWSGPGIVSGGSTPTPTVNAAGTYTLTVIDTANSCIATDTVVVENITTPPDANAGSGQTITCSTTSVTLNGSSTTAGASFTWSGPGIVSGGSTATPIINTAGTYTVTVTDGFSGCTATSTVVVTPDTSSPIADAGPAQPIGCGIIAAILDGSASSTGTTITYNWTTTNGNIVSGVGSITPTVDAAGSYTVTVTNTATGCSSVDSVLVIAAPAPSASFTANPMSGTHPLPVDFTNTSTLSNSYVWDFGDGSPSVSSTNPSYTYNAPGTYTVTLIASNNNACPNTATATIIVFDDISVLIPNIFTPNNDGNNDQFKINSTGVESLSGEIYDRWGLKIYELKGVSQAWDGHTQSGSMVTDGTYYYILQLKGYDKKEYTYTGFIQVLQ
ncbi:MAG: hypothetical protein K0S44_1698 [Bacteroidetes bacterium]|jgi:gliding motility-associated-like protein|nr:hypothetical protein [Bacteroidota bacterium]